MCEALLTGLHCAAPSCLLSACLASQNDSNRVRGRPQYRELKLQGCEAQQAAEAAAYARSWEDSVVLDIFSWQLQSTMTCASCGKRSHAFDSAQELLVAIPAGSQDVTLQVRGGWWQPRGGGGRARNPAAAAAGSSAVKMGRWGSMLVTAPTIR